jgi:hypothetical protein
MSSAAKQPPRDTRLRRVVLASATVLLSVNLWTGCPLFAVWVGSRVVPQSGLSMGAVFVVVAVLVAAVVAVVAALTRIGAAYDELTERPATARRVSPWMRSMRSEREQHASARRGIGTLERIVAASVVLAVLALEVWFFFFAGSSIGSG